jgi:hypothetical protein
MRNFVNHNAIYPPTAHQGFASDNSEKLKHSLNIGWAQQFRTEIIPLIPVEAVAELFCPNNGRPTKDLTTMCGLLILQEMFNLSDNEAVMRLRYDLRFAHALNLPAINDKEAYVAHRTYDYFLKKCKDNNVATLLFNETTNRLIDKLKTDCDLQRLDSVHFCTNMVKSTRLGLLTETVKKFLNTIQESNQACFKSLPQGIIDRYLAKTSDGNAYFGQVKPHKRQIAMLTAAKDMYHLINKFESISDIAELAEFKLLGRVFHEQCDVKVKPSTLTKVPVIADSELVDASNSEIQVTMKPPKEVSPNSVQHPSDTDAGYSHHKGCGYQAQITETFTTDKSDTPGFITSVKVENAADHDANALVSIVDELESRDIKPKVMTADGAYGGDGNVVYAAKKGVTLISPVSGKDPDKIEHQDNMKEIPLSLLEMAQIESMSKEYYLDLELYPFEQHYSSITYGTFTLASFNSDDSGKIISCPMGQRPKTVRNKNDDGAMAYFKHSVCLACSRRHDCPVKISAKLARLTYTDIQVRLSKRRAFQNTKEFKYIYRKRSGIEATNSQLARMGLKKLRVRGVKSANLKIKLKALGLNCMRVIKYLCPKTSQKVAIA